MTASPPPSEPSPADRDVQVEYSVVIPCFRSGRWLPTLIDRAVATMGEVTESFEILLINDASPDDTWLEIGEIAAKYPQVRGLDLQFNVGQFRATMCGFENVRGAFVITMDDDLQHPPEELRVLIDAMAAAEDTDCVIGALKAKRHSPLRLLGTRALSQIHRIVYRKPAGLKMSAFRIMRRELTDALVQHGTVAPNIGPLILRTTHRIRNVDVEHAPRPQGKSGYSLFVLARMLTHQIVTGSTLPLTMLSTVGLFSALISGGLGVYYASRYMVGAIRVPGFATQVLLTAFLGGLTLLSVGVLGQYVARIIDEVSRPPRYIIRADTKGGER